MGEPILGRAYPALLAPGLRVCLDSAYGGGMGTLLADPLAPEDGYWVVWDADLTPGEPVSAVRPRWPATLDDYRIDYADPHTRDRVCRALADAEPVFNYAGNGSAPWWYGVACSTSERIDAWHRAVPRDAMTGDGPALALRAVADAVWGEATEEVPLHDDVQADAEAVRPARDCQGPLYPDGGPCARPLRYRERVDLRPDRQRGDDGVSDCEGPIAPEVP